MPYFFPILFFYLAWQYVLRDPGRFPKATTAQKIIHSATLLLLGWVCWQWIFTAKWILLHPTQWVEYLKHGGKAYPAAVDAVCQLLGSIVGPTGSLCCYFTLIGREKARRLLLFLLPLIYLLELYAALSVFIVDQGMPPLPVVALASFIGSLPFIFAFAFYRHPRVVESFFCDQHDLLNKTNLGQ